MLWATVGTIATGRELRTSRGYTLRHPIRARSEKFSGVHQNTLSNWVKKVKANGEVTEKQLSTSERAELEKLRKDYAQLQMDNWFLKKAAAWVRPERKGAAGVGQ